LNSYDEIGSSQHTFDYMLQDAAVRATIYEPQFAATIMPPPPTTAEAPLGRPTTPPLQEPVTEETFSGEGDEETPQRVWQVVPTTQRPEAPAWVIGSIVHEALALWRFPGSGFDAWVTARAREYGLTDSQQLQHTRAETTRLLRRFQQHPLFEEIEAAEKRLREVPYSYQHKGQTETGYIDLLYPYAGTWTVVDFKTDRVQDEVALQRLLAEKDYKRQLQQYGTAVQQLLGGTSRLMLCFLNYRDEVRVVTDITID
jgi:ATP-dependent exoDNAse (exonuclease V) beta subunit